MHQSNLLWTWITILLLTFVGCSSDSASSDEPAPKAVRSVANKLTEAPPNEKSNAPPIVELEASEPADWTESTQWNSDRGTVSQSEVFAEGAGALRLDVPRGRSEVCSSELEVPWKRADTIVFQLWLQEQTESLGEVQVVLRPAAPGATGIQLAPIAIDEKEPGIFHPIVSSVESEGIVVGEDAPIQVCIVIDVEAGRYVLDDLRFTYPVLSDDGSADAPAGIEGTSIGRAATPLSLGDAEWPELATTTTATPTADLFLTGPTTDSKEPKGGRSSLAKKVASHRTLEGDAKGGNAGAPNFALLELDDPDFCTTETLLPTAPFVSGISPCPTEPPSRIRCATPSSTRISWRRVRSGRRTSC